MENLALKLKLCIAEPDKCNAKLPIYIIKLNYLRFTGKHPILSHLDYLEMGFSNFLHL